MLQGIVRQDEDWQQKRGSNAIKSIKFRIRVLRGKRKAVADVLAAREGLTWDGKRKGGDSHESVSYTAYLEENTLRRART